MYEYAFRVGSQITRPFVTATHNQGHVTTRLGAWVIVNDTWGVTAAHNALRLQQIFDDKSNGLIPDGMVWLGANQMRLGTNYYFDEASDLAAFEFENLPEKWVERARFRSGPMRSAVSVLKMGFPFTNLEVTFDASDGGFKLNTGTPSMLSMEGLTGRQFIVDVSPIPPPYPVHLLETSTPSFPGHSGGPILDTTGTVWGINTRTQPRNSGSSTRLMDGSGVQISIPQQYSFGIGADADTIRGLLDHHSIEYQTD